MLLLLLQLIWVSVNLGVMAMKKYSILPRASELNPHCDSDSRLILSPILGLSNCTIFWVTVIKV